MSDPQEYSWKWNHNTKLFHFIMMQNLPVPDAVVELSKTGSIQKKCVCKKKKLFSTEMF